MDLPVPDVIEYRLARWDGLVLTQAPSGVFELRGRLLALRPLRTQTLAQTKLN